MISFDLECANKHRFEASFKDYNTFDELLAGKMINCPICQNTEIKRLFTGGSVQASSKDLKAGKEPDFFELMRMARNYVEKNFENVGHDFADTARAMHYGIEKERNIYGESTPGEIKELIDEGINVIPLPPPDPEKAAD